MSPIVHTEDGFQFRFWSNEKGERPHVHVWKARASAKWWLRPLTEVSSRGFNPSQRRRIRDILEERHAEMLERWNENFPKEKDE